MKTKGIGFWVANSEMAVSAEADDRGLAAVRIDITGELSRIPSLKNSKLPGRNFINPDTMQRLKALDVLYFQAVAARLGSLSFGTEEVLGLLICGKRPVRFDLDNCAAAVKDWLEPATKRGRGWGVGLVEDDARLNILPVRGELTGLDVRRSVLILRRWVDVKRSFATFASEAFGARSGIGSKRCE